VYCAAGAAGGAAGMSNAADFIGIVDESFFLPIMLHPTPKAAHVSTAGTIHRLITASLLLS